MDFFTNSELKMQQNYMFALKDGRNPVIFEKLEHQKFSIQRTRLLFNGAMIVEFGVEKLSGAPEKA